MPNNYDRGIREIASTADLIEYQQVARDTAAQLVQQEQNLSRNNIHVRNGIPAEDLNQNDETPTTTVVVDPAADSPEHVIDTGTGEEGGWYGWYALDSRSSANGNLENKAAVLYGFQNPDPDTQLPVTSVRVRNRSGGLLDHIDVASLDIGDGEEAIKSMLYENPIALGSRSAFLEVYLETGAADSRFPFKPLMAVAEETDDYLSESSRFLSNQRGGSASGRGR